MTSKTQADEIRKLRAVRESEVSTAARNYNEANQSIRNLSMAVSQAEVAHERAQTDIAKGHDADVDGAWKLLRRERLRLNAANGEGEVALEAWQAAERALDAHLVAHLDLFSDDAEETTKTAGETMLNLEKLYRNAHVKWGDAESAWAPLIKAVRLEDIKLGKVPAFPLPNPEELFSSVRNDKVAARPNAMRVAGVTPTIDPPPHETVKTPLTEAEVELGITEESKAAEM